MTAVVEEMENGELAGLNFSRRKEPINCRIRRDFGHINIEVLICTYGTQDARQQERYKIPDPWAMRDEFLRLRKSLPQLVSFLNRFGAFSSSAQPFIEDKWLPTLIFPNEVWQDRSSLADHMKSDLAETFVGFDLKRSREFPHFVNSDSTILDALYTTVTVDFIRGMKFRVCARADCAIPFRIESRHERKYCSQYCAHLESVRRVRRKLRVRRSK